MRVEGEDIMGGGGMSSICGTYLMGKRRGLERGIEDINEEINEHINEDIKKKLFNGDEEIEDIDGKGEPYPRICDARTSNPLKIRQMSSISMGRRGGRKKGNGARSFHSRLASRVACPAGKSQDLVPNAAHFPAVARVPVGHGRLVDMDTDWIEVGDWVEPHSRSLDPREVAKIEGDQLWLYLLTDNPAGPFPIDNYRVYRKAHA